MDRYTRQRLAECETELERQNVLAFIRLEAKEATPACETDNNTTQTEIEPMAVKAEYTDTFGGEANYGWLQTAEVTGDTRLSIVRKVKAAFGLTGHRCRRVDMGDEIWLYPAGMCRVVFIYG